MENILDTYSKIRFDNHAPSQYEYIWSDWLRDTFSFSTNRGIFQMWLRKFLLLLFIWNDQKMFKYVADYKRIKLIFKK